MSDRNTHWCNTCRRPLEIRRQSAVCSDCFGGFIQELDEIMTVNLEEQNHRPRFMEAVSNFLRQQTSGRSYDRGQFHLGTEQGSIWNPLLIFSGGDYFVGPGVEEFFEHLTSDQPVPPPASRSSIEALPKV